MVVKNPKALVSKKRTPHSNRPIAGRDCHAQVSLDNADTVIDGATETIASTHRTVREIDESLPCRTPAGPPSLPTLLDVI